uniref:Uncharacterized protein n=1 Tax=Arundo donax TaxID=35708 RepID=A0A0A9P050_ARUDO
MFSLFEGLPSKLRVVKPSFFASGIEGFSETGLDDSILIVAAFHCEISLSARASSLKCKGGT